MKINRREFMIASGTVGAASLACEAIARKREIEPKEEHRPVERLQVGDRVIYVGKGSTHLAFGAMGTVREWPTTNYNSLCIRFDRDRSGSLWYYAHPEKHFVRILPGPYREGDRIFYKPDWFPRGRLGKVYDLSPPPYEAVGIEYDPDDRYPQQKWVVRVRMGLEDENLLRVQELT